MKKMIAVLCCLVFLLLAGCAKAPASKSSYQPTEIENISISIEDISPTGATVTIKDTNKTPYIYGQWYKIEEEIDGTWYDVDPVIDNYGFEDIGYVPNDTGEVVFAIDWQWLYGKLPAGNYRLLKEVNFQHISIGFSIP